MDIVEFVEKTMEVELLEWQKKHLRVLEKLPPNTDIRIVTGRCGKTYIYMKPRTPKELIRLGSTPNNH